MKNVNTILLQSKLIDAILLGQYETVLALLDEGAFVDARDPEHDETALMLASERKNLEIVRLLMDQGADINLVDNRNYSALMHAIACRQIANMRLLLESGADTETCDEEGRTAIVFAVQSGDIETVKTVLNYAPASLSGGYGRKALEAASDHGFVGILGLLQKSEA